MELPPVTLICLLLLTTVQVLSLSQCVSRAGSPNIDTQCQKHCALGECPNFCLCVPSNASDSCAKLAFLSNNKLAINETVKPGTPIFTIQVTGQERWGYKLGRDGPVDGSVWSSLSKYLKLKKIGNQYEMIVEVTPDLEDIFLTYGIKLTSLKLVLTCERRGLPNQVNTILLEILPVNEHPPQFFVTPLKTQVPENTKVGTDVYLLSDHTIDPDVNSDPNEVLTFGLWKYLPDALRDGGAYFQMSDTLRGVVQVKVELDFEVLQPLGAIPSFLNVSASDVGSMTSYTTFIIDVIDVDDLPPEFYHPSCLTMVTKSKPCVVSYEATIPLHFQGQVINITPGLIQAKDMDSLNDPVKFSLKPGPGESPDIVNTFVINETTGSLFVLSPFLMRREIPLVIVARESNKNGRSAETSLLITVEDTSPVEHAKLESSDSQAQGKAASSNTQASSEALLISTIVLSLCVLLLVITSFVLWAKLKSRRMSTVQPATVSTRKPEMRHRHTKITPLSSEISIFHESKHDNLKTISPSRYSLSGSSASYVQDVGEELESDSQSVGLPNNRNQQNATCNQSSATHLISPMTYKTRAKKHVKISTSALSSFEVKRVSITLADHPNTGNACFGKMALSEYPNTGNACFGKMALSEYPNTGNACFGKMALSDYPNTGSGRLCVQNVLAVSDRPYTGNAIPLSSNVLILSGIPQIGNNHQKQGSFTDYQNFLSGTQSHPEHHPSPSETDSATSIQTQIFNVDISSREVSKANILTVTDRKSSNREVTKVSGSDVKIKNERYMNKQTSSSDQRKGHIRGSSDDYNDKESDDGLTNDNSISRASTESFAASKSVTISGPNRDMTSVLSTASSSDVREDNNHLIAIRRSSEPFTPDSRHKTPLLITKAQMVTQDTEQSEELVKNNNQFVHESVTKNDGSTNNRHSGSLHNQENIIQPELPTNSPKIVNSKYRQSRGKHFNKSRSVSSSIVYENPATNETRLDTGRWKKSRHTSEAPDCLRRHLARSMSINMSSKSPGKEDTSTEQHSGTAVDAYSLLSRDRKVITQTRPHTSDDVKHTKKSSSSELPGRPLISAPSRLKKSVRPRKMTGDVNPHRADYMEYIQDRPAIILQRKCRESLDYSPLAGYQHEQPAHLYPLSVSHFLIPEHDSPDHVGMHNQGDQMGEGRLREEVYISRSRLQPYSLPRRQFRDYVIQQQIPRIDGMQQQQYPHKYAMQQQQQQQLSRNDAKQQQIPRNDAMQKQLQHGHVMQHQRSYSVSKVTGHHHPRDKWQGKRSKPVATQERGRSPQEAEQQELSEEPKEIGTQTDKKSS